MRAPVSTLALISGRPSAGSPTHSRHPRGRAAAPGVAASSAAPGGPTGAPGNWLLLSLKGFPRVERGDYDLGRYPKGP